SLSNPNIANPIATPGVTTTYTVTVTDGNGCQDTDEVTVIVNPLPTADAGADQGVCIDGSVNLSASGGVSYSWAPAATLSDPTIANPIATPVATTSYTVTVTDSNGCQNYDDVTVTVNPLPVIDAGADQTICFSPQVATLTSSGGLSYVWMPGGLASHTII